MKAYLGSYVKTAPHGYEGRVTAKHDNFSRTNEDEDWLAMQNIPITEEQKNGIWYSILCRGGGSILVPENNVEIVEPFELNNDYWEKYYFGESKGV